MTLAEHLRHLLWLMEEPYVNGWKAQCWHRAQELASDPEMAELPSLLTAEMQKRSNSSKANGAPFTDQPRRNDVPRT